LQPDPRGPRRAQATLPVPPARPARPRARGRGAAPPAARPAGEARPPGGHRGGPGPLPGAAQAAGAGRVARLGPGPPAARCRRPRLGRRAADPRRRRQAPPGPGDADVIRAGRARGHVVSSAPGLADPRPATPLEEVAVAFGRALRRAGVAAGPERVRMLAEALQHVDVMSRR